MSKRYSEIIICVLIALHILPSSSDEYNAVTIAIVNMSSPVADHPISHATDLDLNTYFQTDSISSSGSWVLFDFINFGLGYLYVINLILWTADTTDKKLYAFANDDSKTDYSTDAFCTITQVKDKMFNCSAYYTISPSWKRYILIRNKEQVLFRLSELALITESIEFKVSKFGQASQSNVYDGKHSAFAIDDNIGTCIHTATSVESDRIFKGWWRVDLTRLYYISSVALNDANAEWNYKGFYSIYVSPDYIGNQRSDIKDENLCLYFNNTLSSDPYTKLNCSRTMLGRCLTVVRIGMHRPDCLNFCEIVIYHLANIPSLMYPPSISSISSSTQSTMMTSNTAIARIQSDESNTITTKTTTTTTVSPINPSVGCLHESDKLKKCENDQITIGVVVGFVAVALGGLIGYLCGQVFNTKKLQETRMELVEYEKRYISTQIQMEEYQKIIRESPDYALIDEPLN